MAVIDREGNIFDATPSGGWIGGAVILGDTGIGMSVRGEQFWLDAWYPNLHEAIEWPRVQTLHLYGSFWPHPLGLNQLNVEEDVGSVVIRTLRARGHDVQVVPPRSISGCATAVMIDPRTQTRIAGADPRRDCYAAAY